MTVSYLKIVTNTHFFAFFSPPQGAREVLPCAPTRACPPPHVLPPRLSCTTQSSWAPRHSLCWRWHFSQPVNTLWSPSCCYAGSCDFLNFCVMHPVVPSMCAVSVATIGWCVWAWKITHCNECTEKMVFRTERVECRSVGRYDGRLKLSVLHTLCITDYIT